MRHLYTNRLVYLMAVILLVAVLVFAAVSLQTGPDDEDRGARAVASGEAPPASACGDDPAASIDTGWVSR